MFHLSVLESFDLNVGTAEPGKTLVIHTKAVHRYRACHSYTVSLFGGSSDISYHYFTHFARHSLTNE
jgi:hypothetical protein